MDKLDTIECVGIGWPEEGGCCSVFVEYRRLGRGRSGDEKAPQEWAKPPGAQNRGGIWGLCILAPPPKKGSRWGGRGNPQPSTISQSNRRRGCRGNRWWNHGPENGRKPKGKGLNFGFCGWMIFQVPRLVRECMKNVCVCFFFFFPSPTVSRWCRYRLYEYGIHVLKGAAELMSGEQRQLHWIDLSTSHIIPRFGGD